MMHDNQEISFPWNKENEENFFKLLNQLDDDSVDFCGENAIYKNMNQVV